MIVFCSVALQCAFDHLVFTEVEVVSVASLHGFTSGVVELSFNYAVAALLWLIFCYCTDI